MINLIKGLVALVGVFWLAIVGGAAVWWWDRRPANTPSAHIFFWRWTAPPSLAAQLTTYKLAEAQAKARVVVVVQRQGAVNAAVQAAQAAEQSRIRIVTKTLIKEVPTYVTPKADARCVVPDGFVRLHDAAAAGVELPAVPDRAGQPPDTPSGLELSSVGRTVVANYGACNGWRASLIGWQAWYRQQRAAGAQ